MSTGRSKRSLRALLFWPHLVAGVGVGAIIGLMACTGCALAFQQQLLDWADRGARATLNTTGPALPPEQLLAAAQKAANGEPVLSWTQRRQGPVEVSTARRTLLVEPSTGRVIQAPSTRWRSAFEKVRAWHRWLGREGPQRAMGRAITGVANALFLFLAVSGLFLWWPRQWRWKTVRQALWFRRGLKGRARDWNWHNTLGVWSLPALVVLSATGLVLSYPWASNLVYRAAGEAPPRSSPRRPRGPSARSPQRLPALSAILASAEAATPDWEELTIRLDGGKGGGGGSLRIAITSQEGWPRFAPLRLTLDASGQVLAREAYADLSAGRRARLWLRFLHTGEALGGGGQLYAALASLAAAVLAWTGMALALRRIARWRRRVAVSPPVEATASPATPPARPGRTA